VTLSITVQDTDTANHGGNKTVTKSFKVTLLRPPVGANMPPTITMSDQPVAYTAGSDATRLDATATVTDPDSPDFNTGTLTVQFVSNGQSDDRLGIISDATIGFANNT